MSRGFGDVLQQAPFRGVECCAAAAAAAAAAPTAAPTATATEAIKGFWLLLVSPPYLLQQPALSDSSSV